VKTNREKYDHYCGLIAAKDAEAIAVLIPGGVAPQFYKIGGVGGFETVPHQVTEVYRSRRGFFVKSAPDRISKADLEAAIKHATEWTMPSAEEIYVGYAYSEPYGRVTGAEQLCKFVDNPRMAWDAQCLIPEIERRKELYAPREGCKPCQYCQKQTPENTLIPRTIYYRDRGGLATKVGMYCSLACGGNDQCGHEG